MGSLLGAMVKYQANISDSALRSQGKPLLHRKIDYIGPPKLTVPALEIAFKPVGTIILLLQSV